MKHLGDITKMSGFSTPPVDVITFGSPCQDLSVAGKRAGLAGERSGLFMEAVRIIKEMREATNGEYPKYAVWENVPGAFSSNKGEDFRAVLEELARIKEAGISIPEPDKSKWAKAGLITGDDWSIAWRTMDAQYWGVPQRRLRISLVLDLTGGRAEEILFEPESLRGHFAPGIAPGQATAVSVENGAGTADRVYAEVSNVCAFKLGNSEQARSIGYAEELAPTLNAECGGNKPACAYTLKIRSGCEGGGKGALVQTEKSATLSTLQDQTPFVAEPPKAYSFDSLASNSMKSSNPHSGCREVEIAKILDTSPPDPAKNQGGIAIVEPTFCIQGNTIDRADTAGENGAGVKEDVCYTLNTIDRPAVVFALDCRNMTANEELSATLQAKSNGGQSLNYINPVCYAATTEPNMVICDDCSPAIRSRDYKDPNIVCYDARGNGDGVTSPTITGDHNSRVTDYTAITLQGNTIVGADLYNGTLTGDKAVTLTTATGQGGANTGPSVIEKIVRWIVRRITPTECERLQGYQDGWTDLGEWIDSKGKTHKAADTPRYKALGNSIALPQWYYVLGGISDRLPDNATLGSLFDGIGGFPYVWAKLHNDDKSLCVWASEIEEFPIAVTKKQFPENNS